MSRVRALKVLVGVRERRQRPLDEAVQAAQQRVEEARGEVRAAEQAVKDAVASEARERDKLRAMTDPGEVFDVNMLTVREHVVEVMKGKVAEQQQDLERCNSALDRCVQDLGACRAEVARNRQKIQLLKDDIAALRSAQQLAEDDLQDEESEEAAISRLVMANSANSAAEAGA